MSAPSLQSVDPSAEDAVSCFSVVAQAEVGIMARVLQVFAKRGLLPNQWYSTLGGLRGEDLHMDFQVTGLGPHLRERIAESLRQLVGVETVLTSEKRRALTA